MTTTGGTEMNTTTRFNAKVKECQQASENDGITYAIVALATGVIFYLPLSEYMDLCLADRDGFNLLAMVQPEGAPAYTTAGDAVKVGS